MNNLKISLIFSVILAGSLLTVSFFVNPQQNFVSAQIQPIAFDSKSTNFSTMNNSTASTSNLSGNSVTNETSNPSGVAYTAKFECGSIFGGEGPLRPGHYDTDISIFNKQGFETTMFWNVIVNNGPTSNAILINMNPETSTSITCKDIRKVLSNNNDEFLEGFAVINVSFDSSLQSSKGLVLSSTQELNPLQVQVFYTANALDVLPHQILVDKISFYVIQDGSGKIPKDMYRKTLDISVPSTLNKISNTEDTVKMALQNQYNLTDNDLDKIVVRIKDVSVGVGVLVDDHAISLFSVNPQLVS